MFCQLTLPLHNTQRRRAAFGKTGNGEKAGGLVFNILSVGLEIKDMKKNDVNGDNGTNLAAASLAFVPGGGWLAAPLLFLMKKTDRWLFPQYYDDRTNNFTPTVDTPVSPKKDDKTL